MQSLGYKEVLNVRWANEDPNPRVQRERAFDVANQTYNAVMAHGGPAPYPDMSTLGTGDAYPTTDGQYAEMMPTEYQHALHYAGTYYPGASQDYGYDPATAAAPQEESALSLLSAYDVDSYADRYGSTGEDQQQQLPSAETGQTTDDASSAASGTAGQDQQADYTPEQWRQWYMYYYGYVPGDLPPPAGATTAPSGAPLAASPGIGPTQRPAPTATLGGQLPQQTTDSAPAKKLRTM
jgi:hypothetical protein